MWKNLCEQPQCTVGNPRPSIRGFWFCYSGLTRRPVIKRMPELVALLAALAILAAVLLR
jgi:hypothetical protein